MSGDRTTFCTFTLGELYFGVEVSHVQEVLRQQDMTRIPLARDYIRGLINLRGQIVTAIDLRRRLALPESAAAAPMNVVIRTDDGAVSLLVDEIEEILDASTETLDAPPENLDHRTRALVSGIHKFPDRLMLVLDTDAVLSSAGAADDENADDHPDGRHPDAR